MDDIKKIAHYNILFDYYNKLLTDKQVEYFIMYFQKDYSLKEVAEYYHVSRNAVHSALTATMEKLDDLESMLNLNKKSELRKEYYQKYQETKDETLVEKIMEVEDNYGV